MTGHGHRIFLNDKNVLKLTVVIAQPYGYAKNYRVVHFKWVSFMVCVLYPNKAVIYI